MVKPINFNFVPDVVGWFQPHVNVVWEPVMTLDRKTGELVPEPSRTKQSFKDECDINLIVKKFEAGETIDHINRAAATGAYVDLPSGLDLQTGLNMIKQAEEAFMALPASTRAEFNNDPVEFVEAFNNPTEAQQEQWIKLGLASDTRPKLAEQSGPPAGPADGDKAPKSTPSSDGSK